MKFIVLHTGKQRDYISKTEETERKKLKQCFVNRTQQKNKQIHILPGAKVREKKRENEIK